MSQESPMHVTRWGDSGPRVVMIHGGAQGSGVGGDYFFALQERLAEKGWRLIVPDRPGHGRSSSPGRPDDAETDGKLAADLLGDGAHLVGHSFGGCVALAAASLRPMAVRSLTLIEPAMHNVAMRDPRVMRFGLRAMRTMLFSLSATSRARRFSDLVGIPPEIMGRSSTEELTRIGKALRRLVLPSRAKLEAHLSDLGSRGLPLLVVTGGWNPAFEASSDEVVRLGGGKRVVVRSEHHFPHLVSEEFNDVLVAFITQSEKPS